MGLMGALRWRHRRRWAAAAAMAALLALAWTAWAAEQKKEAPPAPALAPAVRIPVAPLGYVAPSPAYLRLRFSFNSLDFIDPDHLLFTFHKMGLLTRIPDDDANDTDQEIEAEVIDIKTGKVQRTADWRMHDRQRYLWALRNGEFLVRVRNSFFLMDQSLELRPYLDFDSDVEEVQISPGRGLLLIEVKKLLGSKPGADAEAPPLFSESDVRQTRTEILLLRPGEKKVLGAGETLNATYVPLLEDGILSVDEGKKAKQWVVMKISLDKTRKIVGELTSECAPQLTTLSDDAVLAQNCPAHGSGTDVSVLALQGGILWQDHWLSKYIWARFESSVDGSRFADESLEMNREVGSTEYFGEDDVQSQPVGVFDTRTGRLVLVENASPILSAGQNFALSADGRRFAILRNGAIEVYDLPAVETTVGESGKGKGKSAKGHVQR